LPKKVYQYDLDDNFIKEWECKKEAQIYYNNSHISSASKGKRKTAAGFIWKEIKND
jgi:hypothetical protein